jgi:TetR/AcrR family transcriptional regulator
MAREGALLCEAGAYRKTRSSAAQASSTGRSNPAVNRSVVGSYVRPVLDRHYMDQAYTPDRGPLEQLYAAAEEYLRFYLEHPDYFRMLAFPVEPGQYAAGHELSARLVRAVHEQNSRMVEALRRGVAAGQLRDIDPEEVATILWAAWNGLISLGWRPDSLRRAEPELRQLLRTATDVVATGLLAR